MFCLTQRQQHQTLDVMRAQGIRPKRVDRPDIGDVLLILDDDGVADSDHGFPRADQLVPDRVVLAGIAAPRVLPIPLAEYDRFLFLMVDQRR